jgi:uncharacterized protein with NAD-binding domain and iron-sulfur cluster
MTKFLAGPIRHLLPNFTPQDIFEAPYSIANVEPSARYVQTRAGSTEYRIPIPRNSGTGNTGFTNLYVAGDWTRNGLNAGCVEAAVTSGLLAARAISGSPDDIVGESDFPAPE